MNIRILASAVDDLEDGYRFYENQQKGLGSYFLDSLFSDIDSLKLYGGIHSKAFGYHRSLSKRFPFAIYYSKESDTVSVMAVLDCRRDPNWISARLTGS